MTIPAIWHNADGRNYPVVIIWIATAPGMVNGPALVATANGSMQWANLNELEVVGKEFKDAFAEAQARLAGG
jgi:hypothetical protein